MKKKLMLIFGDGGGGHKASALALKHYLILHHPHVFSSISLHNGSMIAGSDFGDHLYNFLLQHNLTMLVSFLYTLVRLFQPMAHSSIVHKFKSYFMDNKIIPGYNYGFLEQKQKHADQEDQRIPENKVQWGIVSFIPFLNSAMIDALPDGMADKFFCTVMTDFDHSTAHPWLQDPNRQNVFVGTEKAKRQAEDLGFLPQRIIPTDGMIVNHHFYEMRTDIEKKSFLEKSGFNPQVPTVMVFFGGICPTNLCFDIIAHLFGLPKTDGNPTSTPLQSSNDKGNNIFDKNDKSSNSTTTAQLSNTPFNLICITGKNAFLLSTLRNMKAQNILRSAIIEGFTCSQDLALYMQVSSVIIGKPGPGVVTEALVSGTPCILFHHNERTYRKVEQNQSHDNTPTLPPKPNDHSLGVMEQEKAVVDWVLENDVGALVSEFHQLDYLLTWDNIRRMRTNVDLVKPRNRPAQQISEWIIDKFQHL